jgi:cytochrome c biogenesis protein
MKKNYIKKIIKILSNLQLAISLLFIIGIIIAIGTVIEQDQSLTFYQENYSETKPMFGFLTWKIITFLSLNQLYTNWWFLLLLLLFSGSLIACTFTTQLPSVKTFKLWKFFGKSKSIKALNLSENVNLGYFNSVAYYCNNKRYHFFRQRKKGYAYSGLLGRVAPVIVHASIVLLLFGSTVGSFGGFTAQEIVPRGEISHIQNLTKFGNFSYIPQEITFRVNDFWITYTKDFKIDQFYSDLSLLSQDGKEIKRKTIFVNEPFVDSNNVFYQTDWEILGMKLRLSNNDIFQIPFKKNNKEWPKFLVWFNNVRR